MFPSGGFDQNVIIFIIDMSPYVHVDNKKNEFLIIVEGPTQRLDGTTLTVKKNYSLKFIETRK